MTEKEIIALICVLGVLAESIKRLAPNATVFCRGLSTCYSECRTFVVRRHDRGGFVFMPWLRLGPTLVIDSRRPHGMSVNDHLDVPRARRILDPIVSASRRIMPTQVLITVHLCLLTPAVLLGNFLPQPWFVLAVSLVMFEIPHLVFYYQAHLILSPERRGDRISGVAAMVLFPPSLISALDKLAPHTTLEIHPLTAARVLCGDQEYARLRAGYLRAWQHPVGGEDPSDAAAHLEALGEDGRCAPEAPRREAGAKSYCPRCHYQYTFTLGACPDCSGVEVRLFE